MLQLLQLRGRNVMMPMWVGLLTEMPSVMMWNSTRGHSGTAHAAHTVARIMELLLMMGRWILMLLVNPTSAKLPMKMLLLMVMLTLLGCSTGHSSIIVFICDHRCSRGRMRIMGMVVMATATGRGAEYCMIHLHIHFGHLSTVGDGHGWQLIAGRGEWRILDKLVLQPVHLGTCGVRWVRLVKINTDWAAARKTKKKQKKLNHLPFIIYTLSLITYQAAGN